MKPISYKRHRFPPDVIRHAVRLYFRFTPSLRDVEALLAERGIEVSDEAIRCWTRKFGVHFALASRGEVADSVATDHRETPGRLPRAFLILPRGSRQGGKRITTLVVESRRIAVSAPIHSGWHKRWSDANQETRHTAGAESAIIKSHNIYYENSRHVSSCCTYRRYSATAEHGVSANGRCAHVRCCTVAMFVICSHRATLSVFPSMPLHSIASGKLPPSLTGRQLVDRNMLPRFWASVWAHRNLAGLSDGTLAKYLGAVDRLYAAVVSQTGRDRLDAMIGNLDFDGLETALGGFQVTLHNDRLIDGTDREATWDTALRFVTEVVEGLVPGEPARIGAMTERLHRLKTLYGQLTPGKAPPAAPIRALPSLVVEELYGIFNPESAENPFKTNAIRYRNFLIFIILLHLGLRPGELLLMKSSPVREGFDYEANRVRRWINVVRHDPKLPDTRSAAPRLKTTASQRQRPITEEMAVAIDTYDLNHRGRAAHPFLLVSQEHHPLSRQSLDLVFATASSRLSDKAINLLKDNGKDSVTGHDLRHTSAVVHLARMRDAGIDHDEALLRLRRIFGWAPTSSMPQHYAAAYFEAEHQGIWDRRFDSFVDTLREIGGKDA